MYKSGNVYNFFLTSMILHVSFRFGKKKLDRFFFWQIVLPVHFEGQVQILWSLNRPSAFPNLAELLNFDNLDARILSFLRSVVTNTHNGESDMLNIPGSYPWICRVNTWCCLRQWIITKTSTTIKWRLIWCEQQDLWGIPSAYTFRPCTTNSFSHLGYFSWTFSSTACPINMIHSET